MKFGWINAFGALVVAVLLIPNIIYSLKNKGEKNLCSNKIMNAVEQIGRYGCIVLMWLPLLVPEFGFSSVAQMLFYTVGDGVLLLSYLLIFGLFLKKKSPGKALALAVLPACIFLISGILLKHYLLIAFAIVFAVGHIYVTAKNLSKGGMEK